MCFTQATEPIAVLFAPQWLPLRRFPECIGVRQNETIIITGDR